MLPTADVAWPPATFGRVTSKLAEWDAWYSGDPDSLAAVYGARTATGRVQQVGGVVGMFRRLWWGRQVDTAADRRDSLHLPVAADLARVSADLLYSDPPHIVIPSGTDDKATADRLAEYVDDGMHNALATGAEVGAALGGRFHRVTVDPELLARPFVSTVDADAAYPTFRWGRLVAVTFSRVVADLGHDTVLRHLERHELDERGDGIVFHGLYQGTRSRLGHPIPLTEAEATKALARVVDEHGAVIGQRTPGLNVVYVPNVTPNRLWRSDDVGKYLGRSDFDGVEPVFDAIDETYSSLMRDVRLAKGRIIVPSFMMQSNGPGSGSTFNLDREVYEAVNVPPTEEGGQQITPQQFAIRAAEHLLVIEDLVKRAIHDAGYSGQTLSDGIEGGGSMTATEVHARERRTYLTRDRKIRHERPALLALTRKLLHVDRVTFRAGVNPDVPLEVTFADTVQESTVALAQTAQALATARAASTQTLVKMTHPDWTEPEVDDEVQRILAETGVPLADPYTFRG